MKPKTVLITGANSGIGLATAKLFLKNNFVVFAHYNTSNDAILALKNEDLHCIQGDLSKPDNIHDIFSKCIHNKLNLDVLVNNAGAYITSECIEEISAKDFDYVLDVNLKAPFLLSQLAFKHMKKNCQGRIINISSIGVKYGGNPSTVPYTISKAGLETITTAFAKAGAEYNVLVNAIRVGVTNTNFHNLNPAKNMNKRIDYIPLKRWADPMEIAESILFLASEKSSFITGSILTVAGGE